jgi:hypothetical protein
VRAAVRVEPPDTQIDAFVGRRQQVAGCGHGYVGPGRMSACGWAAPGRSSGRRASSSRSKPGVRDTARTTPTVSSGRSTTRPPGREDAQRPTDRHPSV